MRRSHRHIHEPGTFVLPHPLCSRKRSQSYVRTATSHTFLYRRATIRLWANAADPCLGSDVERSAPGDAGDADAVKKKIIVEKLLKFRRYQPKGSYGLRDFTSCFRFGTLFSFLFFLPTCVCLHLLRTVGTLVHGPWLAVGRRSARWQRGNDVFSVL